MFLVKQILNGFSASYYKQNPFSNNTLKWNNENNFYLIFISTSFNKHFLSPLLSWLCPWTQSNLPAEARLFSVGTLLSHLIRQLYLFRRLGCQDVGGCAMYVDTHQVSVPADTVSCDVSRKVCLNEWGDRRWPMLIFKAWHKLLCSLFHCFSLYLYNCEPFTPCVPLFRFKLVFRYWYHAMELPWWLRW